MGIFIHLGLISAEHLILSINYFMFSYSIISAKQKSSQKKEPLNANALRGFELLANRKKTVALGPVGVRPVLADTAFAAVTPEHQHHWLAGVVDLGRP
jgi:hypothetical protein